MDATNKRIVTGTMAVQEATARITDLEAFIRLKGEELEEARGLQEVVDSHRAAVKAARAAGSAVLWRRVCVWCVRVCVVCVGCGL